MNIIFFSRIVLRTNVNKLTQKYCVICLVSGTTLGDKLCRTFFMGQIFRSVHVLYVWFVWVSGAEAEPTKSIPKSYQSLEHPHCVHWVQWKYLGWGAKPENRACGNSPAPKPVAVAKTIEKNMLRVGFWRGRARWASLETTFCFQIARSVCLTCDFVGTRICGRVLKSLISLGTSF